MKRGYLGNYLSPVGQGNSLSVLFFFFLISFFLILDLFTSRKSMKAETRKLDK